MKNIKEIIKELKDGLTVPYLGLEIFKGAKAENGEPIPFDNDSLIIAVNNKRAMSPRLMFEASRAFMYLEQKKGRRYIEGMHHLIFNNNFEPLKIHKLLTKMNLNYIIDTNLDTKLSNLYSDRNHILIIGIARITAEFDRFEIYKFDKDTKEYSLIEKESIDLSLPIIFKPLGTFEPKDSLIISDADYVDWLTEAMGGFAIPPKIKEYRKGKKYLFFGVPFSRDTNRMVANEITIDLDSGYVLLTTEPTKKELKFIEKHNLKIIDKSLDEFITELEKEI